LTKKQRIPSVAGNVKSPCAPNEITTYNLTRAGTKPSVQA
jgi:hypothetical protein